MKKENLFHSFEILVREYDTFPMPEHSHSFFELCGVVSGRGQFVTQQYEMDFSPGDLFLVKPAVSHVYKLCECSKLVYMRFSDYYLDSYFTRQEKDLLYAATDGELTANMGEKDRELLSLLMGCIALEYGTTQPGSDKFGGWWLCSVLHICLRSLWLMMTGQQLQPEPHDRYMLMLQYIQAHLSEPELLQSKALGKKFGMSQSYVGSYFKSCGGESLREYVKRCRLLEAERLLLRTDMPVSEIAFRLGFFDCSHLTNIFNRQHGMSPLEYRRRHRLSGSHLPDGGKS